MNENLAQTMHIRTLTVKNACKLLSEYGMDITPERLRFGLQQGVFPFGDAVKMAHDWSFCIYERKLREWIEERANAESA